MEQANEIGITEVDPVLRQQSQLRHRLQQITTYSSSEGQSRCVRAAMVEDIIEHHERWIERRVGVGIEVGCFVSVLDELIPATWVRPAQDAIHPQKHRARIGFSARCYRGSGLRSSNVAGQKCQQQEPKEKQLYRTHIASPCSN